MKQPNYLGIRSRQALRRAAEILRDEAAVIHRSFNVDGVILDRASERIRLLVAGLLGNEAALERAKREAQQLRADAIGYAAWLMDDDRIERAL